jgi:hypothetical protein
MNSSNITIEQPGIYYRREELCRSICSLPLHVITVGHSILSYKKRPIIFITARVHSGETPGSNSLKGIYNFITDTSCLEAKFLRKMYTFILIPILNPDGVVCGNYRNSVIGADLNRQWIMPS